MMFLVGSGSNASRSAVAWTSSSTLVQSDEHFSGCLSPLKDHFSRSIPGKKQPKIALTPTPPMRNYHYFNEKNRVSHKE